MKKTVLTLFAALTLIIPSMAADKATGQVNYSLPKTTICFDVTAKRTVFKAGPYAQYAKKYLGFSVGEKDNVSYELTSVKIKTATEADQSARYSLTIPAAGLPSFMQLTSQGLVVSDMKADKANAQWRFPVDPENKTSTRIRPSNLTEEKNTLYKNDEGTVSQKVLVEKDSESKAKEAADMIFKIRENRYKILTGDTDATYSGEAMKAAVDALERMEKDYLTLFTGESRTSLQTSHFEIIPDKANEAQLYVAFRLSDSEGLSSDNVSGKPYYLSLKPEAILEAKTNGHAPKSAATITYRIPSICEAVLSDGVNTILQTRIPVYQLGIESTYPIAK